VFTARPPYDIVRAMRSRTLKNFILIISILILPFLFGCTQTQTGNITTKYTSFMGINLGQSLSEVEDVFGAGTLISSSDNLYYYLYSGKIVVYKDSVVVMAYTILSSYSIENISINSTSDDVLNQLGTPTEIYNDTSTYYWYYSSRNIFIRIFKSTNSVNAIGIYDPSRY